MSLKKQFTIMEFSRLTGIKRENLRFYDRIGLLSPETRGDNKYRYYSRHQLNTAYLIGSLRGLGVGIQDIKHYALKRTPETSLALFAQHDARIQAEIERLNETRLIMQMYSGMIKEALAHDENAPFIEQKEQEPIFLCPPVPADMDSDDEGVFSYEYAEKNGVNLGFPQGTLIPQGRLEAGEVTLGSQYYFKVSGSTNACKPAGRYAVAYGRCNPWKSEPFYQRLLDFICRQGLRVCGGAYEEYPLGDSDMQDPEQVCLRVEIPVEKWG